MDFAQLLQKFSELKMGGSRYTENAPLIDDRARLFEDKAHQVRIEERYEKSEKRKYTQCAIPVETHTILVVQKCETIVDGEKVVSLKRVPRRKLKINKVDLKKELPALKKGEPITLISGDEYIHAGFDDIQNDCIILALGGSAWTIYDKLHGNHRLSGRRLLFDLELSHNEKIYTNKIEACREVREDQLWLDALVPEKYSQLGKAEALPDLLDGIDDLTKDNIVCLNDKLTSCQRSAIVNMMKAKNRPQPYLLFGPPGTGKTVTLAELVVQIFTRSQNSTILVSANSNICVELLAQRIVDYGIFKENEVVRLIAEGRLDLDDAIDLRVKKITKGAKEFLGLEKKPRIVLATCQKSSLLRGCNEKLKYEFDYVIVDEVGHCQEPETLIPVLLRKPGVGSIIFGGDPHQLQPVSKSPDAPLLKESILSRLFESEVYQKRRLEGPGRCSTIPKYDERYITKLLDCHRSDARVMRVNNKLFYEDELKFSYETPEVLLDIFGTSDPLLFSPIVGKEGKLAGDDTSLMNKTEATRCIDFVRLVYNGGFGADDVGIIAAYRSQVTHISSLFDTYKIPRCKVASIDEFQGEEKQIIIISTVRSSIGKINPSLGFLREYQRFNVAVSRARAIVIVVGDPRVLREDKNWAAYIHKATEVSLSLTSFDSD